MTKRVIIPNILAPVSHYCHVVEANGIVWVSGLVGMLSDKSIPDNTMAQFEIILSDLEACLLAVGSSRANVVKVRIFMTDISERAQINQLRKDFFAKHKPASSLFEVSALVDPRMTVELEAEAVICGDS
jgi:enamine deaminase RidA (YjgF/YER057c/UK114 family)